MSHSWSFSIEKLMIWRAGSWNRYDSKTSKWTLQMAYNVLVIAANTKIFESLDLHSKIKGIYKGDILILIVSSSIQEVRKIKFQINDDVAECLKILGKHVPIVNHDTSMASMAQDKIFESQYRNIEDVMKNAVYAIGASGTLALPTGFNDFVKLCLLDPKMPQIINETQNVIERLNKL